MVQLVEDEGDEAPVCVVTEEATGDEGTEIVVEGLGGDVELFTRHTDPFKSECVNEILRQIKIGNDLTSKERQEVDNLIREFADAFALSVKEVFPVKDAVHKLNIPEDATFSKKVRQKPVTPPQRKFLHEKIDEMLEAGIIESCQPEDVKCVSPTTLAQKAH
ncbi:hypothetical protein BDN72DRAFT_779058, partial [Pluteus cervinus]